MAEPTPSPDAGRAPVAAGALAPGGQVGRFRLLRMMAQEAQAQQWLAFDARRGSEVTIKLVPVQGNMAPDMVAQWLQITRGASHLIHPHIVPVVEVNAWNGWLVQVCDHVPGTLLATLLLEHGKLVPHQALALACELLDALVLAHAAGIVHGKLSPADVRVDAQGRARIMHMGFAEHPALSGRSSGDAATRFQAPETARGMAATAHSDTYCVGRLLVDMLCGKAAISDGSPAEALAALEPAMAQDGIDDELLSIVRSMCAQEPTSRPTARESRAQLLAWASTHPAPVMPGDRREVAAANDQALQILLQRMSENSDFPAMSLAVTRILGMASSETVSAGSVTDEILKDVALSNKLLRMVNTAYYARGGSISTVSRAVSLVGFDAIRNMALGLILLEGMRDKAHAEMLTEEFLRSLLAASVARALSQAHDGEEAFIGALFQNLGRLLAGYYFPREALAIKALVLSSDHAALSEDQASTRVLGQRYESLALAVARAWKLPLQISRHMRKPASEPPPRPADEQTALQWITLAANQVADTLLRWEPAQHAARLEPVYTRYCRAIGVTPKEMHQAVETAREGLIELVDAMELRIPPNSAAKRLLRTGAQRDDGDQGEGGQGSTGETGMTDIRGTGQFGAPHEMMALGSAEISQLMVGEYQVRDVVRMVMETMFRAKAFGHVIFCMRDPKTDSLTGRFGLGEGVDAMVRGFDVPLGSDASDLFRMICDKGSDTLIADASAPRVVQRLPPWYRRLIDAPAFLVLPLLIKARPFGLIYADVARKDALEMTEKELECLRTLRDQVVLAFKPSH